MNERWALEAIDKGEYREGSKVFDIKKVTPNYCDGCYFQPKKVCPHEICNSRNGGILVLNEEKSELFSK